MDKSRLVLFAAAGLASTLACGSNKAATTQPSDSQPYAGQAMTMHCEDVSGMPSPVVAANGNTASSCLGVTEYAIDAAGNCNRVSTCGATNQNQTWTLSPNTWLELKSRVYADTLPFNDGESFQGDGADADQYTVSVTVNGVAKAMTTFQGSGPSQLQDAVGAICPPPDMPE